MGGSALPFPTIRIDALAYHRMAGTIEAWLASFAPGCGAVAVPSYRKKADFGDIDILVRREVLGAAGGPDALVKAAQRDRHSRAHVRNGPVTSIEYREAANGPSVQVDVVTAPEDTFAFALAYLSWNDLGNLIGRVAHRMGFKFGLGGLSYTLREGTHVFATLPVTTTISCALEFLGYEPERFHAGFDTLDEVFEYAASSRYFASELYLLENRNHAARTRDRKRKSYQMFLAWLAQGHGTTRAERHEWDDRADVAVVERERFHLLLDARRAFPVFARDLVVTENRLRVARLVKAKFNGGLVMQWTGLSDRPLGMLMRRLRGGFESPDAMTTWLHLQPPEAIRAWVEREAAKP